MRSPNYYLAASSSFFIAPILYGIHRGHIFLPLASILTTVVSMNYWLDPSNPSKRNLDLIVSKSCGVLYFLHGYNSVESIDMRMVGYANLFLLVASYNTSCILHKEYNELWVPFHIAFHYFTSVGKLIVL